MYLVLLFFFFLLRKKWDNNSSPGHTFTVSKIHFPVNFLGTTASPKVAVWQSG